MVNNEYPQVDLAIEEIIINDEETDHQKLMKVFERINNKLDIMIEKKRFKKVSNS